MVTKEMVTKEMVTKENVWAIVPAAGMGSRFGGEIPKQYLMINGKTVMQHTVDALCAALPLSACVIALNNNDSVAKNLAFNSLHCIHFVAGGHERMDSVLAGLEYLLPLAADNDWVLVHDVARPCITAPLLLSLLRALENEPCGGVLATPVSDTLQQAKISDDTTCYVASTVDRQGLWQMQTPQMFRFKLLLDAMRAANTKGIVVTDEASAMQLAGHAVRLVPSSRANIKLTEQGDLALVAVILSMSNDRDTAKS